MRNSPGAPELQSSRAAAAGPAPRSEHPQGEPCLGGSGAAAPRLMLRYVRVPEQGGAMKTDPASRWNHPHSESSRE